MDLPPSPKPYQQHWEEESIIGCLPWKFSISIGRELERVYVEIGALSPTIVAGGM